MKLIDQSIAYALKTNAEHAGLRYAGQLEVRTDARQPGVVWITHGAHSFRCNATALERALRQMRAASEAIGGVK